MNLKNIFTTTVIGLGLSFSASSFGYEALSKNQVVQIINNSDISSNEFYIQELDNQNQLEVKEFSTNTNVPYDTPEGIPYAFTVSPNADVWDGYTTNEFIIVTLDEAKSYGDSDRLNYYLESFPYVRAISRNNGHEVLARMVVNRAEDIFNLTLPTIGNNTDYVRSLYTGFFKQSLILASGYVNNQIGLNSFLSSSFQPNISEFIETYNLADFSYQYAKFLLRYTQGLTSDSSQAIIIARILSYLVWDLNLDMRRSQPFIRQTLADIYRLQRSNVYKKPLQMIEAGLEPGSQVAGLRRGLQRVLDNMERRIPGLAGLRTASSL